MTGRMSMRTRNVLWHSVDILSLKVVPSSDNCEISFISGKKLC
jgi:hypothetical protein